MAKIKKGDNVMAISGKDRGKTGKIIKAFPKEGLVIVENINLKKKHRRPKNAGQKGEKISMPGPVSVSAVMLLCKNCGKPVRTGYKTLQDGKKVRICKKCGSES